MYNQRAIDTFEAFVIDAEPFAGITAHHGLGNLSLDSLYCVGLTFSGYCLFNNILAWNIIFDCNLTCGCWQRDGQK